MWCGRSKVGVGACVQWEGDVGVGRTARRDETTGGGCITEGCLLPEGVGEMMVCP